MTRDEKLALVVGVLSIAVPAALVYFLPGLWGLVAIFVLLCALSVIVPKT